MSSERETDTESKGHRDIRVHYHRDGTRRYEISSDKNRRRPEGEEYSHSVEYLVPLNESPTLTDDGKDLVSSPWTLRPYSRGSSQGLRNVRRRDLGKRLPSNV